MLEPRSALLLPLAIAGLVTATPLAQAQDFYKGKTLTIVVGFSPGGGYDVNARAVSRHISKHIPGNPSIIVQNMPSAGSMTSVRYLDATAPKDGTVVTVFNPGLITQSIVTPEKVTSTSASSNGSASSPPTIGSATDLDPRASPPGTT